MQLYATRVIYLFSEADLLSQSKDPKSGRRVFPQIMGAALKIAADSRAFRGSDRSVSVPRGGRKFSPPPQLLKQHTVHCFTLSPLRDSSPFFLSSV